MPRINIIAFIVIGLFSQLSLAGEFHVASTSELRAALEVAATNGEDDTIMLADGAYKTTDDGLGTFIYFSNEANELTLIGSSADNVMLSGDSIDQILKHQSTEDAPLNLEGLSFINGSNEDGDGGGVFTDSSQLVILNCIFANNSSYSNGGGLYFLSESYSEIKIINSRFLNNSTGSRGGGYYAGTSGGVVTIEVRNSKFIDNNSGGWGGGFHSKHSDILIVNSLFDNNSVDYYSGGGFYGGNSGGRVTVSGSIFINNTAVTTGGGFQSCCSLSTTVVSNTAMINNHAIGGEQFENSEAGGALYSAYTLKISNSLFYNNSNAVFMKNHDDHIIVNSIFHLNEGYDIGGGDSVIISSLSNNYIDSDTLTVPAFASNNIFNGTYLGFIDLHNGDYSVDNESDLIDAGTDEHNSIFDNVEFRIHSNDRYFNTIEYDISGNSRVSGAKTDIGPYEFSSTKPTLSNFTYTGEPKELSQLTFNVDYFLDGERTVSSITYDFENKDVWSNYNAHTFDTAGEYTVKVKVTDSEGEFSIASIAMLISEISLEDKLSILLSESDLDTILPVVVADKNDAVLRANSSGVSSGKQYVQNNPLEFNLFTPEQINDASSTALQTGKDYVVTNPSEFSLFTAEQLTDAASNQLNLCKTDPASCGIEVTEVTTVQGFTQSDIDDAVNACVSDPASCGIEVTEVTTVQGFTQSDIDDAVNACVSDPASCGIEVSLTPSDYDAITGLIEIIRGTGITGQTYYQGYVSLSVGDKSKRLVDKVSIIDPDGDVVPLRENSTGYWDYFTSRYTSLEEAQAYAPTGTYKLVVTFIDGHEATLETDSINSYADSMFPNPVSSKIIETDTGYAVEWSGRNIIRVRDIGAVGKVGIAPHIWSKNNYASSYTNSSTPLTLDSSDSTYVVEVYNYSDIESGTLNVRYTSAVHHLIGSFSVGDVNLESAGDYTYLLSDGWNMVGGKSASTTTDIKSFLEEQNADSVWHWEGLWKSYIKDTPEFLNSLTSMEPNNGYFVYVSP